MSKIRDDEHVHRSRSSRFHVNANFPPCSLCKCSRVCYRGVVRLRVHFPVAFLHFPSLWLPSSFHFAKLELLMYQATRIDGVRGHFVVNTASAVVSMRTGGGGGGGPLVLTIEPVLCLECHVRKLATYMHTRDPKQFYFDLRRAAGPHENPRHRRWTRRRDTSRRVASENSRD